MGSSKREVSAVILIPAYNAVQTIGETLGALQQNPELRFIKAIIILDDASRDETIKVAKAVWRSTVPLQILSNVANAGQWTTTNSGLERLAAEIEWAFILHADDVVKPNWISLYLHEMTCCRDDIAIVCSSYDNWYPESGRIDPGEDYPERPHVIVRGNQKAVRDTLDQGCWWHISGCAVRIKAFRQIGKFKIDLPYLADWDWLLRCLSSGFSVLYLPRSTMRYRQHGASVSSNSFRQGRDIDEMLSVFTAYREQGYLSKADYQKKVRRLLYLLCRRILVRGLRSDFFGMRHHGRLLAKTSMTYFLNQS